MLINNKFIIISVIKLWHNFPPANPRSIQNHADYDPTCFAVIFRRASITSTFPLRIYLRIFLFQELFTPQIYLGMFFCDIAPERI